MNDTTNTTTTEAPKAPQLANIVRGQIPVLLVHMIRFNETGNKEADIAKKYGTTGGKVADIVKNRNFAYITKDFAPTQEQKDAAVEWLKQVPDYDKVGTDEVVTAVEKIPVATAEQAAAFLTARSASRKSAPKTAPTEGSPSAPAATAPAPKAAPKDKSSKPADKTTVDSLLS